MYVPKDLVETPEQLKTILGPDIPSQVAKVIHRIDRHCRAWIERCPFVVVSSRGRSGAMDTSPKGDPPGFVKVLDERTLAIPDRPGNHRGDTFHNVLDDPQVSLLFLVPRRTEVLRMSGTALIARDADLLASMAVKGRTPDLALVVRIDEAFFHCGKSIIRSGLWEPERWGAIAGLPSYAQAIKDHARRDESVTDIERRVRWNETDRLY